MVFRQNEDTILNLHITPEASAIWPGLHLIAFAGMENAV